MTQNSSLIEIFPGNSYIPVVGVHTTLLLFSGLFLPRTTFLKDIAGVQIDPAQSSSLDRPQHSFLEPLTINPLSTLVYVCLGAAVLQGWWAGYMRDWWSLSILEGSESEKRLEKAITDRQKIKAFAHAWLATLTASIIFHGLLVLFGAPFTLHASRTYGLALLLSILTVYTPAFVLGPPTWGSSTPSLIKRFLWIRLFAEFTIRSPIERALVYPALGSIVFAWLGIIPIALDWDRPWQAWPLTPAYGAISGYTIASIASLTVNTVRQIALEQQTRQQRENSSN
ncbi:hypothetical protein P691DRAFT_661617 [Macrolepiota fuliginosa MF-IS2]|uniref:PIG-F-domain-containing protein n=1 Tax=Macrolepiota fuliginosa MF-IS2 TaxID=1400762 RepID=A0A9P5XJY6_9AGAR|nr:hypothetical protein P691DRAFT_661617 [Macrolepiota fuliginosa MF-IS2]